MTQFTTHILYIYMEISNWHLFPETMLNTEVAVERNCSASLNSAHSKEEETWLKCVPAVGHTVQKIHVDISHLISS